MSKVEWAYAKGGIHWAGDPIELYSITSLCNQDKEYAAISIGFCLRRDADGQELSVFMSYEDFLDFEEFNITWTEFENMLSWRALLYRIYVDF